MAKQRRLIVRRTSDGSIKAEVYIPRPTKVTIYKCAKKLAHAFGHHDRYCFDVTEFAELFERNRR